MAEEEEEVEEVVEEEAKEQTVVEVGPPGGSVQVYCGTRSRDRFLPSVPTYLPLSLSLGWTSGASWRIKETKLQA